MASNARWMWRLPAAAMAVVVLFGCGAQAPTPAPTGPGNTGNPSAPVSSGQTPAPGESVPPGVSVPPGASASPGEPAGPSSAQELIAADLAAGTIDLATALEYRAWAMFSDGRLPQRYLDAGSDGHDQALFDDIGANLASLPAEKAAELGRYLLRPTDPESPFSSPPESAGGAPLALAGPIAQVVEPTRCVAPRQWFSSDFSPDVSADRGFKVWACGSSRATVAGDLEAMTAIASRVWAEMTVSEPGGMGLPVPDKGVKNDGGDSKTDVYLLEPLAECAPRTDPCVAFPLNAVAAAPKDWPLHCGIDGFPVRGCSGYMLVGAARLDSEEFVSDFAHEFFHVLQIAHNGELAATWYHEASATWAEFHYEQAAAKQNAYNGYRAYQSANRSLLMYEYGALYQYRAWVWPLFQAVEQAPSSIFLAWQAIEGAVTRYDVDAAVDQQFSFADNFHDFAVRNAQPAAYIPPNSMGLDEFRWQTKGGLADFPLDAHMLTAKPTPLSLGKTPHTADVDPLTAQYDEYTVSAPEVRQIDVDISGLTGFDTADLDVLAQLREDEERIGDPWRRVEGDGGKVRLCRDQPNDDVFTVLMVIISNHVVARDGNIADATKRVKGSYTIEAKDKCDVPDGFEGTFTGSNSFGDTFHGTARYERRGADDPLACAFREGEIKYCYRLVSATGSWTCPDDGTWEGPIHVIGQADLELIVRSDQPSRDNSYHGVIQQDEAEGNAGCVTIGPISWTSMGADDGYPEIGGGWILSGSWTIAGDFGSQTWGWSLEPFFDE